MESQNNQATPCCPEFDPARWDGKTNAWKDKLFITDSVPQFLHRPLPSMFARKMTRMWNMAQEAAAAPELEDFLLLAYDPSPWKSELYLAVTKEVPEAANVAFTGEFLSRVFDGPYNAVPRWAREMDAYVASQGKKTMKYYFYFPTCPKCAEVYGHNYAVAFAEVE